MDEKTILQVLAEQKEELKTYSSLNLVRRSEEELFEWNTSMAQVVVGVRRSGKSTLCHQALLHHNVRYGYVNMDDDRLLGLTTQDLNVVLNCIYQLYGADVEYLFLDEIQDVKGWHLFVNRLLRQGMHVVLTGSNAKLLSGELATHLTGRYNEIRLFPFSYSEVCNYNHIDTDSITTKADAVRKSEFYKYVHDGGFPELLRINRVRSRHAYIEGLLETVITKDIARRYKIRNAEGLRRIAYHLINNNCQGLNYDAVKDVALLKSPVTAQKYASYLAQAFLIYRVQKFSYKSKERIRSEKSYVIDLGFISNRVNALLPENIGWRLENAVCIELLRRNRSQADDIYYYKPTARSKEVDFVVCNQGNVVELVQVAYSLQDYKTFKRETEALIQASDRLKCDQLTIVTMDDSRDIEIGGKVVHVRSAVDWFLLQFGD